MQGYLSKGQFSFEVPVFRQIDLCYYIWVIVLFDIGGSKTRIAISGSGEGLDRVVDLDTQQDWQDSMNQIDATVISLVGNEVITTAVGGIAGVWDMGKSKLISSPNLTGWVDKPMRSWLTERWKAHVILENDAVLGGVGEAVNGAGKDQRVVGFLTIGTGVGGARIVDGRLDVNAYGFEPGHQLVMGQTLESWAGGKALTVKYGVPPAQIVNPQVWEEVTGYVAQGVANLALLWSPDVIVLGGSVAKRIDIERLKVLTASNIKIYPWLPKIEEAALGDEAGLWGALELAKVR